MRTIPISDCQAEHPAQGLGNMLVKIRPKRTEPDPVDEVLTAFNTAMKAIGALCDWHAKSPDRRAIIDDNIDCTAKLGMGVGYLWTEARKANGAK